MRITSFLLLIFVFIPKTHAQMTMIGFRGGVNLANQHYENLPDGESIFSRMLPMGGAEFDFRFTNSLDLSLQILDDQKGAHAEMVSKYDGGSAYATGMADWTISYLEVPIIVKIFITNSIVRPYFFAGPSVGFLLSNIERLKTSGVYLINGIYDTSSTDTVVTVNISDSTSKIDFSIIAGAGLSIKLNSGLELFVDAGYAFGLTNIDNYFADKAKDHYIYSRDIRIAAGILFPIP